MGARKLLLWKDVPRHKRVGRCFLEKWADSSSVWYAGPKDVWVREVLRFIRKPPGCQAAVRWASRYDKYTPCRNRAGVAGLCGTHAKGRPLSTEDAPAAVEEAERLLGLLSG